MGLFTKGLQSLRTQGLLYTFISFMKFIKYNIHKKYCEKTARQTVETVGSDLHIKPPTNLTNKTQLGDNVNFNGMRISGGGKVIIGDNFHSGTECLIMTQNHNYDNGSAIPYDDTYITRDVSIGDNVWLGSRVTILPGVTIEEGAVIQAGSTVTKDIPKGAIAGGHPVEVFKSRNMEHYEDHKSENNFH